MFFFFMHNDELGPKATLQAARQYILGLEKQIAGLQVQLEAAKQAEGYWQRVVTMASLSAPHGESVPESGSQMLRNVVEISRDRETNEAKVLRYAKEVLGSAEFPLDRHDLINKFRELGFTPNVTDPARFVGKILWKSNEFIHAKHEGVWSGYWLKSRELPGRQDETTSQQERTREDGAD